MSWILVGIIWEASNVDLPVGVHSGSHGETGSFSEKKGVLYYNLVQYAQRSRAGYQYCDPAERER